MARLLRTSSVLKSARQRLAGLKSITPAPDFGNDLNAAGGQAVITDCAEELDNYNQTPRSTNSGQSHNPRYASKSKAACWAVAHLQISEAQLSATKA